jgi:hypothetical protein
LFGSRIIKETLEARLVRPYNAIRKPEVHAVFALLGMNFLFDGYLIGGGFLR